MQATSRGGTERVQQFVDVFRTDDTVTPVPLLVVGAGLLIAITIIHLQDQGGLLGGESPTWLKYGYYLVEIGSVISALLVIARQSPRLDPRISREHRPLRRVHHVSHRRCPGRSG